MAQQLRTLAALSEDIAVPSNSQLSGLPVPGELVLSVGLCRQGKHMVYRLYIVSQTLIHIKYKKIKIFK